MITSVHTEPGAALMVGKRPLVSWGAIFAGWLIGNAVMLLLMNLGSAIGLQVINPSSFDSAKGVAAGAAVWTFISWGAAFFISGLFAAWFAGHVDRAVGAAHGVCVWALAAVAAAFVGVLLGALGVAGTIQAGKAAGEMGANAPQTQTTADDRLVDRVQDAANEAGARIGLTAETGAPVLTAQERANAAQAAQKTADVSAGALWVMFLASIIGLGAAALGGAAGSRRLVLSYQRF